MIEQNSTLAEFIREKMSDILALAKEFRDEYGRYAEFIDMISEHTKGANNAEKTKPEVDIRLGLTRS
jgi:hypothetical protein